MSNMLKSPVAQDFIWLAEYPDGTHLPEFDFVTKQENSFYNIDRTKLFRFGLVGHGSKICFERDGVLNVAGRRLLVSYEVDGKEYNLNGDFKFNVEDIITYKDAQSAGLVAGFKGNGRLTSQITQFNVGYKNNISVGDTDFHFKPIVKLPLNSPAILSIWLVSNKKLNGDIVIRSNGKTVFRTKAPLEPNVGGELNWTIQ